MKRIKYIIVVTLLISATSCVTPKYKTADNIIEQTQYRGAGNDTSTIAAIKWHDYYKDGYLRKLIDSALVNNIDLKLAISRIEQASQYYKSARLGQLPTVGLGVQATLGHTSNNGLTPMGVNTKPCSDYTLSALASWELDIWGKLSSSKRGAYASLLSQEATKNGIITTIISEVATAYYQLIVLDTQLSITKKTIANYTNYLSMAKRMKEQGQSTEVAVLQAKAQLYGAKAYLPQVMVAIQNSENYISILLGKEAGTIERSGALNFESISNEKLFKVGVPTQLLQYRPDIMAAEYNMRAAHEAFNVAKASMYPSLTLSGSVGMEGTKVSNWFSPSSLFWNAVAGITAPIFNHRQLRTQKEVAKLQKSDSFLLFKSQLLRASVEVSNAIAASTAATTKAEYTKQQFDAISLAYNYSIKLFERGFGSYLDVLAAQQGLFSTELALYNSYLEIVKQKIELYRSLGGGWQ